jgi:hypothetical protein
MWSIYAHCKLQTSGKNCETTISAAYMGHHHALGILGALDIGEIHQIITKDLKPTLSNYHFQPKILRRAMILKGNMEADETGWGNTFLAIFILELPMVSNRFCGIFQITDFAS